MATIASKLQEVRNRLEHACHAAQRDVTGVTLVAVSKTVDAARVREAVAAGQHRFGENYVQEGVAKMDSLHDLAEAIEWHFIGPLQSNKARTVAERFAWVHSVDRVSVARALSRHRPAHLPPLQICLQVNISEEPSKSGLKASEVAGAAKEIVRLPGLLLRGLMAVPKPAIEMDEQRKPLAELRALLAELKREGLQDQEHSLDTLSMGMTDDLEAAVFEGATIVRVGSAIFGTRATRAGNT